MAHKFQDSPVHLLHGEEFLTDDGTIRLLPRGLRRLQLAHSAGRDAVIDVNGKLKLRLDSSFGEADMNDDAVPASSSLAAAVKQARDKAAEERNPAVRDVLQEIERSFRRLVEMEHAIENQRKYDRPFAHFKFFDNE